MNIITERVLRARINRGRAFDAGRTITPIRAPEWIDAQHLLTGYTLRAMRKEHNITQVELAGLTGVSQTAIAEFETGKRQLRTNTVAKLLTSLNVKVQWTVGRTD